MHAQIINYMFNVLWILVSELQIHENHGNIILGLTKIN
jgi:hypothetical protein